MLYYRKISDLLTLGSDLSSVTQKLLLISWLWQYIVLQLSVGDGPLREMSWNAKIKIWITFRENKLSASCQKSSHGVYTHPITAERYYEFKKGHLFHELYFYQVLGLSDIYLAFQINSGLLGSCIKYTSHFNVHLPISRGF